MAKSLLDLAYEYVSKQSDKSNFQDIWEYCVKEAGLSEEEAKAKVSRFYTNLMLDGRFVTLGENQWDLRSRHKYETVHIDMSAVYNEVEAEEEGDPEELADEREYNDFLDDEKKEKDDDSASEEEGSEEEDDKEDTDF